MRKLYCLGASLIALSVGVVWGVMIYKKEVFPYGQMRSVWNVVSGNSERYYYGPWSIGIYEGLEPFSVEDSDNLLNPVITAEDVSDIDAKFVADPFIFEHEGRYTMFFETLNRETGFGVISYAESANATEWTYKETVIQEPFHLSYPHIFEVDGDIYMIPESHEDRSVRLYKATSFPDEWEYSHNLLSGYSYIDPTIFQHEGKWWMFVSTPDNKTLNLYYSDSLVSGWTPHVNNPVVKNNLKLARMAGPVFKDGGRIYRFAQSAEGAYGTEVYALEILDISENEYTERLVSETPVLGGSGVEGWNSDGMHHLDLHKLADKWIGVVDGRFY